jgi:hypothetical protein
MNTPQGQAILHRIEKRDTWFKRFAVISVIGIAIGFIFAISLLLHNQEELQRQGQRLQAQTEQNRKQGQTNQRYIRCIILIPRDEYADRESLAVALDKCGKESVLPPAAQGSKATPSAPAPIANTNPKPQATSQSKEADNNTGKKTKTQAEPNNQQQQGLTNRLKQLPIIGGLF